MSDQTPDGLAGLAARENTANRTKPLTDDQLRAFRENLSDAIHRDGELYLTTDAPKDMLRLLDEVENLRAHNAVLTTEVRFQGERAEQARADYDATEVTVGYDIFKRGELREVLANVTASRDEYAREAKRQAARAEALRAELGSINEVLREADMATGIGGVRALASNYTKLHEVIRETGGFIGLRGIPAVRKLGERYQEAKAEAERIRVELETKSVIHRCCEQVVELKKDRAHLKEGLTDEATAAERLREQIGTLSDWLVANAGEPKGPFDAAEAAIHAIEERDAKLAAVRSIEPTMRRIYQSGNQTEREVVDVVDELIGQALDSTETLEQQWKAAKTPPSSRTASQIAADLVEEHQRGIMPLAEAERLHGLEVTRPGDKARLNLDEAATALYDWTTQLRQSGRGPWPHGRIEVIQGIEVAARWLKDRAAYERQAREQQAADLKRSLDAITYSVGTIGRAWRDAFAKARAEREAKAEPTLRDVLLAAYRAGLGLSKDVDDVDQVPSGEWHLREWSITNRHGREVGRLEVEELPDAYTYVRLTSRRNRDAGKGVLPNPTLREILDEAREVGLIGGTDA